MVCPVQSPHNLKHTFAMPASHARMQESHRHARQKMFPLPRRPEGHIHGLRYRSPGDGHGVCLRVVYGPKTFTAIPEILPSDIFDVGLPGSVRAVADAQTTPRSNRHRSRAGEEQRGFELAVTHLHSFLRALLPTKTHKVVQNASPMKVFHKVLYQYLHSRMRRQQAIWNSQITCTT